MVRPTAVRLCVLVLAFLCGPSACFAFESRLDHNSPGYRPEISGGLLPDFSEAGYGTPGSRPPRARTVMTVSPPEGDATAVIQAALDSVSREPIGTDGLRGAVELSAGTFTVSGTLRMEASGVVLRGTARAGGKTRIVASGAARPVLTIFGKGTREPSESARMIVDDDVPVGQSTIRLDSATGLSVGDWVIVQRPFTKDWISEIGMDRIPLRPDGAPTVQWEASPGMFYERRIVAIKGDAVSLNTSIPERMKKADGARIFKFRFDGRIENVIVQDLEVDGSDLFGQGGAQSARYNWLLKIDRAANIWIENLEARNFTTYVEVGRNARDVTVTQFRGTNEGPTPWNAAPAAFSIQGQMVLIENCQIHASRMIIFTTQSNSAGPNVFRACTADGTAIDAGPHQRWATGTLYEDLVIAGGIKVQNRNNRGSGHGWAGAYTVVWNCVAGGLILERPPGADNWAFGTRARLHTVSDASPGEVISEGKFVEPFSLFQEQVRLVRHSPAP